MHRYVISRLDSSLRQSGFRFVVQLHPSDLVGSAPELAIVMGNSRSVWNLTENPTTEVAATWLPIFGTELSVSRPNSPPFGKASDGVASPVLPIPPPPPRPSPFFFFFRYPEPSPSISSSSVVVGREPHQGPQPPPGNPRTRCGN